MPAGLDDWDRIWARRDGIPRSSSPGCSSVVRLHLGPRSTSCARSRGSPRQISMSTGGQRPRRAGAGLPAVAALHRLRPPRPAAAVRLHEHPPVPHRPGQLRAHQAAPAAAGDGRRDGRTRESPPCRPATCSPAPTGTSTSSRTTSGCTAGRHVPEGGAARPEDARRQRRQGRSADHRLRRMRAARGDERGAGRGRARRSCRRRAAAVTRTSTRSTPTVRRPTRR